MYIENNMSENSYLATYSNSLYSMVLNFHLSLKYIYVNARILNDIYAVDQLKMRL